MLRITFLRQINNYYSLLFTQIAVQNILFYFYTRKREREREKKKTFFRLQRRIDEKSVKKYIRRCKGLTSSCTRDIPRMKRGPACRPGIRSQHCSINGGLEQHSFRLSLSTTQKEAFLISYHTKGSRGDEKRREWPRSNCTLHGLQKNYLASRASLPCRG